MGAADIHNLDHAGHFCSTRCYSPCLSSAHLPSHPDQPVPKDSTAGQRESPSPIQSHRCGRHVQGQGEDAEDDSGHSSGLYHLLGSLLHCPAVVRMGHTCAKRK